MRDHVTGIDAGYQTFEEQASARSGERFNCGFRVSEREAGHRSDLKPVTIPE